MEVTICPPDQKDQFNNFVAKHPNGSIQQTYDWGLFQQKVKNREKFWPIMIIDKNNQIRGTAIIVRQKLPFKKSWLYCPRGPLTSIDTPVWNLLLEKIKKIAKLENAIFLRIDPYIELENYPSTDKSLPAPLPPPHYSLLTTHYSLFPNFRPAHANYQPEWTIKIDLTKSEADILAQMKPKGRYNIKLAEKKGVKIIKPAGIDLAKAVDDFYALLKDTTTRDGFSPHNQAYYHDLLSTLPSLRTSNSELRTPYSQLYLAYYQNTPIAGLITTSFKDTATYYFGASSSQNRELMAPYLLQWQAIKDAKSAGLSYYDFFGIAPASELSHHLAGVTDFKKKFGGQIYHYAPAQEYVFKKFWYWLMLKAKT